MSNGETSSINEYEKVSSNRHMEVLPRHIFRDLISRRDLEESTSGKMFEESSSNKDECEVTNLSYKQLFKLNIKLIKDMIRSKSVT